MNCVYIYLGAARALSACAVHNCLSMKMATTKVIAEAALGAVKSVREDKDSEADEKGEIEQKEFFWDQFVTYISTAILALTVLNVSVEFLRVTCFPPTSAR